MAGRVGGASAGEWPTPRASDGDKGGPGARGSKGDLMLPGGGLIWPTPNICGNYNRKECSETSGDGLETAVTAWPTPSAADAMGGHATRSGARSNEPLLNGAVRLWPTPAASNPNDGEDLASWRARQSALIDQHNNGNGMGTPLGIAVKLWPTPGAGDAKQSSNTDHHAERLIQKAEEGIRLQVHPTAVMKGQLNPFWCEPLMGWDIGWTDISRPCTGAWPGFPMGQGPDQHPWEPTRTIPKGSMVGRNVRIKAIGNGVVPQCAETAYLIILAPAAQFLATA